MHAGLTQKKVPEIADVSVETICNIEHGCTIPNMSTIFNLFNYLKRIAVFLILFYFIFLHAQVV